MVTVGSIRDRDWSDVVEVGRNGGKGGKGRKEDKRGG